MTDMLLNILATNVPTIIVLLVAVLLLSKQQKYANVFVAGLVVILAVGLLAVPITSYMWSNHKELMSQSSLPTAVIVFSLGIINSIGLSMCVYAFHKRGQNA